MKYLWWELSLVFIRKYAFTGRNLSRDIRKERSKSVKSPYKRSFWINILVFSSWKQCLLCEMHVHEYFLFFLHICNFNFFLLHTNLFLYMNETLKNKLSKSRYYSTQEVYILLKQCRLVNRYLVSFSICNSLYVSLVNLIKKINYFKCASECQRSTIDTQRSTLEICASLSCLSSPQFLHKPSDQK